MKKLPLSTPAYQYIEKSFRSWLDILGYASQTVYALPNCIRELMYWLEQRGVTQVSQWTNGLIKAYYQEHLKQRPNRLGGALSSNHLNKHLQAINLLHHYLRQSGRLVLPTLPLRMEQSDTKEVAVLTKAQVGQLYAACDQVPATPEERVPDWLYPALAMRDKAMLAIYYGCGLRRSEGVHLGVEDILWEQGVIHVRKGKNYTERFVPVSSKGIKHLQTYVYDSRPLMLKGRKGKDSGALFINRNGQRLGGQMLLLRLKTLIQRTGNTELQDQAIGLHTLRHSIATHLLGQGMSLEQIKDFLGHRSLESTQIYTHLLEAETL